MLKQTQAISPTPSIPVSHGMGILLPTDFTRIPNTVNFEMDRVSNSYRLKA